MEKLDEIRVGSIMSSKTPIVTENPDLRVILCINDNMQEGFDSEVVYVVNHEQHPIIYDKVCDRVMEGKVLDKKEFYEWHLINR